MKETIKRVAAIHDLAGFGRSSLCTIIPVLSTMGAQVCPVPTAVLSSHSGGFGDPSYVDLTPSIPAYIDHWKRIALEFDCIYSGYLGSIRQIEIVVDFIDYFRRPDNLVVVDPVMADHGKLYANFTYTYVAEMKKLVAQADVITPNFTEAAFLTGHDYCPNQIDDHEIKEWMKELSELGPGIVVITSVPEKGKQGSIAVTAYESKTNQYWKTHSSLIPAVYPGTGDTFTSVLIGSILQGDTLPISLDRASSFITQCIRTSYGYDYPKREGILLEKELPLLHEPVEIQGGEMF